MNERVKGCIVSVTHSSTYRGVVVDGWVERDCNETYIQKTGHASLASMLPLLEIEEICTYY